jgi:hypothetical protein
MGDPPEFVSLFAALVSAFEYDRRESVRQRMPFFGGRGKRVLGGVAI